MFKNEDEMRILGIFGLVGKWTRNGKIKKWA
jgi:hypothetical protein